MKSLIEVAGEGLESLLNQTITLFCDTYIYTGTLVGVNTTFVKLASPKIVYETGPFTTAEWKDAQGLPHDLYVQVSHIEAFGKVK
jgi:hypothetical protein